MRPLSITMGRLKGLLQTDARLSAAMLAGVARIPSPNLTAAMRNVIYLSSDEELRLWELAQRCLRVIDSILPLQIARGDSETLRILVRSGRDPESIRNTVLGLLEPSTEESHD